MPDATFANKSKRMETIGYLASLIIGVSLGLIGGGGSILTVPILVYLLGVEPIVATAYSLFIVGTTSLVGVIPKYRQGLVNIKTALLFGTTSITTVFLSRRLLVPLIPETIVDTPHLLLTRNTLMMVLFALLMVGASLSMIRSRQQDCTGETADTPASNGSLLLKGAMVGIITGLVGAGGGFLIIPALVLLGKLPMKNAVGTSLLIIAAQSLIGFTGDLVHFTIHWALLLPVSLLAIAGIFLGNYLSTRFNGQQLKKGFGWFVLLMGGYILLKELVLSHSLLR